MEAKRLRKRESNAFAPVLAAGLVALVVTVGPVSGQRPERQQDVPVPGIGVALKAGWQLRFHDHCRFAVPGTWRAAADGSAAFSPDGNNVSIRMFTITSWSAHKAQIKAAYGRVNVLHEDSDRRLWFEFGDKSRVQHYVDVANGLSVCVGLLEARAVTALNAEDVTRIVESIGPVPAHWPPQSK
jgi:hypothetical protein